VIHEEQMEDSLSPPALRGEEPQSSPATIPPPKAFEEDEHE
jgi:hypothetical protein